MPVFLHLVAIVFSCVAVVSWAYSLLKAKRASQSRFQKQWDVVDPVQDDFNWQEEEMYKYRPFRSIYHVTMNVNRTSRTDWLAIENSYERVTEAHKRIMCEHPNTTCMVQSSPTTTEAVREMYDFVLDTLSQRYPKCFIVDGDTIINTIKGTKIPRFADKSSEPRELLRVLGANIEEDIMVLQYDPEVEEYRLQASTGIAGLGFEWREKVGLKLTDIHLPVPQYKEKLQRSMNKYFHRIAVGQFVRRVTWGVTLGSNTDLYSSGNYSFDDSIDINNLDFDSQVHVRLECQTLTRLPVSGFLGFTIRTYMYPVGDIKKEGMGPTLADAIEAWPEDTSHYKGVHIWGVPVLTYLRS